jgi:hypothetical protein
MNVYFGGVAVSCGSSGSWVRSSARVLHVSWVVCWFSPLPRARVFLLVLRFSSLRKNQHFQIPIIDLACPQLVEELNTRRHVNKFIYLYHNYIIILSITGHQSHHHRKIMTVMKWNIKQRMNILSPTSIIFSNYYFLNFLCLSGFNKPHARQYFIFLP